MISPFCLFILIPLSTAQSLTLFAAPPTDPTDVSDSFCCLPTGYITFTVIGQTHFHFGRVDDVEIQADEWEGSACAYYGITASSIVPGISVNTSDSYYYDDLIRILGVIFSNDTGTEIWSTSVYEDNPNPLGISYFILFYLFCGISILASIWLFYRYYKTPTKQLDLHLILVLSIADCLFHLTSIIAIICAKDFGGSSKTIIVNFAAFERNFLTYWSATMSVIIMKALTNNSLFGHLTLKTWILCLLPSFILATCFLMINLYVPSFGNSVYGGLILTITPFIITIGCYIRTIIVFRKNPFGMRAKNTALFLYPTVQILMLLLMDLLFLLPVRSISFQAKALLSTIIGSFSQLTGFANAAIYLFQKRRRKVVSSHPETQPPLSSENSIY